LIEKMQTSWLHRKNRKSCILFFGGWGMDPSPFRDIPIHAHDLLMFFNHKKLTRSDVRDLPLASYDRLHLVAWSMGVWTAAFTFSGQDSLFATATAVNGTLKPIDGKYGIDPVVYSDMIENFSSSALHEFYRSMFDDPGEAGLFWDHRPQRGETDIHDELVALEKHYAIAGPAATLYDHHIVGSRDRIFPARNQIRCWGREICSILPAAHFPFYRWPSWDSIIPEQTAAA